jgi:hypothetical protein
MRPSKRHLLLILAGLALAVPAARAQVQPPPPPAATPAADPAPPTPQPGQEVVVLLKDGQKLKGRLVSQDANGVTIESSGARMQFPAASVQALALPGSAASEGPWPRDTNRTRYLYSPSGFMLRQGEGYLSQTELLITSVGYGVTDWLTLQAGTVLPLVLYQPSTVPFILAVKAGGSPSEVVHLAGGFQTFTVPGQSTGMVGFLYGTLTLGTENAHLGISAGPPFALTRGSNELGKVIVSISGNVRVGRSLALVSENWFVPVNGQTKLIGSAALRFIGERIGVDAGFLFPQGSGVAVPWLDFTWHWAGTGR